MSFNKLSIYSRLSFISLVILSCGCSSMRQAKTDKLKDEYLSQFCSSGDKTSINCTAEWNQAKDHLLCRKANSDDPTFQEYAIFNLDEGKIYESGFIGSSVEWLNDEEIIIKGTSRLSEESLIYNFVTKKTRTKL